MTDAIAKDLIVAKQFEREWEMYHNFYNNCMAESGIVNWLDLRGNHGNHAFIISSSLLQQVLISDLR